MCSVIEKLFVYEVDEGELTGDFVEFFVGYHVSMRREIIVIVADTFETAPDHTPEEVPVNHIEFLFLILC